MRYLAIDYGEKYTGVAISDEDGVFSFPLVMIEEDSPIVLCGKISDICAKESVEKVIVGFPATKIEDRISAKVKKFKGILQDNLSLPIEFFSERGTTQLAQNELSGMRSPKLKRLENQVAAAIMLQDYLNSRENLALPVLATPKRKGELGRVQKRFNSF